MKSYLLICLLVFTVCLSAAEYDRILSEINALANANPQYAQIFDIGKNDQNNTIYGIRLENAAFETETAKPNQLLMGVHHGNERHSGYLCTKAAQKLVDIMKNPNHPNYKAVSGVVMYVVPVLNISGFNANRRTEQDRGGRYLDSNRDYPDPCGGNAYFQLLSTQNIANFVERYNIVSAITVHGYIGTFTFPWGTYTSNTHTLDHSLYENIGRSCCQINGYRTGTHTDVIYPTVGAFEDWAYHKHGIWTMLLELANSPNLDRDADASVKFFTLTPAQRSGKNQHTGKCNNDMVSIAAEDQGRP
jgi:hypothetical protein